jgi:capsular polysaccharide biosynthesis protein
MQLIYPSFTISPIVPENLFAEAPAIAARYLANTELAFPGQFLFSLPNARIRGPHGFVVLNEGAFVVEGNWRASNVISHPLFSKAPLSKSRVLKGNWYSTISYFSDSYHHWLWDDLPRLMTALPHLPSDTQFLIPEKPKDYHIEALGALGIEQSRLVEHSAEVETKTENLWFASPLGHSEWAATPSEIASKLRDRFRKYFGSIGSGDKKFYISRQKALQRRLVNEEELLPIILDNGFETVFAEDLSFKEQAKLFGEANCILAVHGAGLTNMLFASAGARVYEIQLDDPNCSRSHYWMMATGLGHAYKCAIAGVAPNELRNKDPNGILNPKKIEELLKVEK